MIIMKIIFILLGCAIALIFLFYGTKIFKHCKKSRNNVHFYVTRDRNRELGLWLEKPFRGIDSWCRVGKSTLIGCGEEDLLLYKVNPKDFRTLKFEDEPVEVFIDSSDKVNN